LAGGTGREQYHQAEQSFSHRIPLSCGREG
jgi:hypothetical protein